MQSGFSPGAQLNWSLALNVTCKGDLWADLAVPSLGNCDKVYDATLGDRQSVRFQQFRSAGVCKSPSDYATLLNAFVDLLGRSHDGKQYFAV